MYINIYIKLLEPGDKIAGNGGGEVVSRHHREGGGGLLRGMIRAHWAGSSPGWAQSGDGGAQRPGGIYAGATAGRQGRARGRQCGGVLSRLFKRTLVIVLKNNALFIR